MDKRNHLKSNFSQSKSSNNSNHPNSIHRFKNSNHSYQTLNKENPNFKDKKKNKKDEDEVLLKVEGLSVEFKTEENSLRAVKNISFEIKKGEVLGLVGESGSGKSVTALSVIGLIPFPAGRIVGGRILFKGEDLLKMSERGMQKIRGQHISMIFQEPMTSLNPVFTIGEQISEVFITHKRMRKKDALERSVEIMEQVGIPHSRERLYSYPHELSGGQRQRVMIAMSIACEPTLLIADEPTTALDVTIQKQILELLKKLQKKYDMSVLFISHDLGVICEIADQIAVMLKGKIVESKHCDGIFKKPEHPYTKGLISCRPSLNQNLKRLPMVSDFMDEKGNEKKTFKETSDSNEMESKPSSVCPFSRFSSERKKTSSTVLLEIKNLCKSFPLKVNLFGQVKAWIKAVDNVSFSVSKGSVLGLVGESGCGKTTLGRTILRLVEPSSGGIFYSGEEITKLKSRELRKLRRKIQVIFQDPYASLNPRMTIGSALVEPMAVHSIGDNKKERFEKAEELMLRCGLSADMLHRYPHEFSGGQRQRICIARALTVDPEFIICDESVSALDVSVQAQILNLLLDLQEEKKLTYIFISHDLAVVKFISDRVAVMNQGQIVEIADSTDIYKNPRNLYTKKLIEAIPR